MILADENIGSHMVSILRSKNIEVSHIKENHRSEERRVGKEC